MLKQLMNLLRYASVAAVVLAGSCASPINDDGSRFADPAVNHPFAVEPQYIEIVFAAPSPAAGLNPADAGRFGAFVADFLEKGSGAISVSVPDGAGSDDTIAYFGEKLASLGVPRTRILVGSHAVASDTRVKLGYMGYSARLEKCGDWSSDASGTASNEPMPNYGCATQHNIAAQVSDPRDLVEPRALSPADAARRATVMGKYEKGETTASTKTEDQSGKVSEIGK
jgi:pilus assembly protein CpaD